MNYLASLRRKDVCSDGQEEQRANPLYSLYLSIYLPTFLPIYLYLLLARRELRPLDSYQRSDISPVGETPSWLTTNQEFESHGGSSEREWFVANNTISVYGLPRVPPVGRRLLRWSRGAAC